MSREELLAHSNKKDDEEEEKHSKTARRFLDRQEVCVTCGTRIITKYRSNANYCHSCFLDADHT